MKAPKSEPPESKANLTDSIVQIAPQLERFFGTSGRMLKPSVSTIAALLAQIPSGQVLTTDALRRKLADQFGVEVTCPYDTKMALLAISQDSSLHQSGQVPYWRVIKANGALIPKMFTKLETHLALLQAEGWSLEPSGKTAKVKAFKDKLFRLD